MRLQVSKTKNAASFYVVKSVYLYGKRTNKVVEKLGTYEELKEKLGDKDPYEWAEEYVKNLNRLEKENCKCQDKNVRKVENNYVQKIS